MWSCGMATRSTSRVMGVLTVCIGAGPLGMLHVGWLADWLGAAAPGPRQLPVGILTALVGVPLFLVLLHHSRSLHGEER